MNEKAKIRAVFETPALIELDHSFGGHGGHKHHARQWQVERFIWRTEDIPLYRVHVGEHILNSFTDTKPQLGDAIQTRFLEYVPTGRIMYDNTGRAPEKVLFEYRLKPARDTRAVVTAEVDQPPRVP